jgi:hypothetical protein
MTPTTTNHRRDIRVAKSASIIVLLAGIYFFISPWIYGAMRVGSSWNSWIVGVVIMLLAANRIKNPVTTAGLSWVSGILGIWAFISPWVYRYTFNHGRSTNSLFVGVIVFIASIVSATAIKIHHHPRTLSTILGR